MIFKIKRLLSMVITLCMVITLLSFDGITASAAEYGTFIVSADDNKFTITRTGGTTGEQKVYYRTVSQSAIEGVHYEGGCGSLTFAAGETQKTVTVTEYGSTPEQFYGNHTSTGYSNAARTYRFEIYQISGGASLGAITSATRTMAEPTNISKSIFTGLNTAVIKAEEVLRGDYNDDGLGWGTEGIGAAAYESINILDALEHSPYWAELSEYIRFNVQVDIKEENAGYQHFILTGGKTFEPVIYPHDGKFINKDGDTIKGINTSQYDGPFGAFYANVLQHGSVGLANKNYKTYTIDSTDGMCDYPNKLEDEYNRFGVTTAGKNFASVEDNTLMIGISGSGDKGDKFYTRNLKLTNLNAWDSSGPQIVGMGPVSGSYRRGDTITLSVIFDEIISDEYADPSKTSLEAPFCEDLQYAGGVNTNVLYYTGRIKDEIRINNNLYYGIGGFLVENIENVTDMLGNVAETGDFDIPDGEGIRVPITGFCDLSIRGSGIHVLEGSGVDAVGDGYNEDYTCFETSITASTGYSLPDTVTVIIDGVTMPEKAYTYDKTTGNITVFREYITGDIKIRAYAIKNPITVTGTVTYSWISFGYSCSFKMVSPDAVKGTFIIAIYDSYGNLTGVKTVEMEEEKKTYSKTVENFKRSVRATDYKIMFCSGLDTLIPLCEAAEGNIVK